MTHSSRSGCVFLGVLLVFCLIPLVWTLLAALGIFPNNLFMPPRWRATPTLDYFNEVATSDPLFMPSIITSLAVSSLTMVLSVTVSFLMVYGLSHSQFRGRQLIIQSCLILASLPVITYLFPLQNQLRQIHLYDTFIGLLLSETALFSPLAAYVLYGYMGNVTPDFEDAARLDGAGVGAMLRWIVLPVVAPGLAATAIIVFALSWNQLLVPLILTGKVKTIPTLMIDFFTFERELEWPVAAAALVISLLPLAGFVALAQRLLEQFHLTPLHQSQ